MFILQSYDHIVPFFFIIICYSIIIPMAKGQNTSILAELESIQAGKLPQDSIINYVYNTKIVKDNSLGILADPAENFFITITTCKTPLPNFPEIPPAKQLEVWISTKIKDPGPFVGGDKYELDDGYLQVTIPIKDNDGIYIGVRAPKLSNEFSNGYYYFQAGVSTKGRIFFFKKKNN
jgi:hypothetical protein